MTVADMKKLIADLSDDVRIMVIDAEDSCAHLVVDKSFVHSDGTLMLQTYGNTKIN